MKIVRLHDLNNPSRIIPFDAADFSAAVPYLGGSALKLKDCEALIPVIETAEQIIALLGEQ